MLQKCTKRPVSPLAPAYARFVAKNIFCRLGMGRHVSPSESGVVPPQSKPGTAARWDSMPYLFCGGDAAPPYRGQFRTLKYG